MAEISPQFRNVQPSKNIGVVPQSVPKSGFAGRYRIGGQQPNPKPVNLIPSQYHVPQQQADLLRQGKPQGGRRGHQFDPRAHYLCKQLQQFLESECLRPGGVGHQAVGPRTRSHRLGRQVLDVNRLNSLIAPPENGQHRKAPQRLVVHQRCIDG